MPRFEEWLVRNGLLFSNKETELEFMMVANFSSGARVVGAVIASIAVVLFFYTILSDLDKVDSEDGFCVVVTVCVLGVSVFICASCMIASIVVKDPRKICILTTVAAGTFGSSILVVFAYALCDSEFYAEVMATAVTTTIRNATGDPFAHCSNASFSGGASPGTRHMEDGNVSCSLYTGPDASQCSMLAELTVLARLHGFVLESFLERLMVVWVIGHGLVVLNYFTVRVLIFAIPVMVLLILSIFGQFPVVTAMSNFGDALLSSFSCSDDIQVSSMSFSFEFTVSFLAAPVALLLQSISRSRLKRELFFWTKKLDVSCRCIHHCDDTC